MESFFATLECELLTRHRFQSHEEARTAVFEWIEIFYHRQRRHSALGYEAPQTYEHTVTLLAPVPHEVNGPRIRGHSTGPYTRVIAHAGYVTVLCVGQIARRT